MTDVGHRRRRRQYHLPLSAYSGEVTFVSVYTTGCTLTNKKRIIITEELLMRYGFGIDIGGTTVKLAFLDEKGTMIE
jgi:hypothetical protein